MSSIGDLVLNLGVRNKPFVTKLKQSQNVAKKFSREITVGMSKSLSKTEIDSRKFSKTMVDGMSKAGASAKQTTESVEVLGKKLERTTGTVRRSSKSIGQHNNASSRGARAILELSRGAEDAAVSFGVNGLAGAIRGSLNNLTQFAFIAGGATAGAIAGFVAAGVAMIPLFITMSKKTENATEKAREFESALDAVASAADRAGAAAGRAFEFGKLKEPGEKLSLLKRQLNDRKLELEKGAAKSKVSTGQLKFKSSSASQKAFLENIHPNVLSRFLANVPGLITSVNPSDPERGSENINAARKRIDEIEDLRRNGSQAALGSSGAGLLKELGRLKFAVEEADKAARPFEEKIGSLSLGLTLMEKNVRDAAQAVKDFNIPVTAPKPVIDLGAIKDANTALDKLALKFKSPFEQAQANLKKTEDRIRSLGAQAGSSKIRIDELLAAARQQFQKDNAKFLQPVGAVKPPKFTKEELRDKEKDVKAAEKIKKASFPFNALFEELNDAQRLLKSGLLTQGEFDLFAKRIGKRAKGLLPKAPELKFAGALEEGTAGAFSAIINSGVKKPEEKTAKNTAKTAKSTDKSADLLSEIKNLLKEGNVQIIGSLLGP